MYISFDMNKLGILDKQIQSVFCGRRREFYLQTNMNM